MQSLTSLERLSEKISQIVKNQDSLKSENEAIRNELITLKAEKEIKDQEIEKLIEQNAKKDLEIEE
ncbi:MAG: hypothetical protein Q7S59_03065, partial [Sulfurimonas sp.]|nr:hypothetical protein [Sulfurimonas sp.]